MDPLFWHTSHTKVSHTNPAKGASFSQVRAVLQVLVRRPDAVLGGVRLGTQHRSLSHAVVVVGVAVESRRSSDRHLAIVAHGGQGKRDAGYRRRVPVSGVGTHGVAWQLVLGYSAKVERGTKFK